MATTPFDWNAAEREASGSAPTLPAPAAAPAKFDWGAAAQEATQALNASPAPQLALSTSAETQKATTAAFDWDAASREADRANPTTPEAINSTLKYSTDPVTHGLSAEERKYAAETDPTEMENEPWYSKAWEWLNTPLYDLHKWGTREGAGAFERGLETGLEDIGSGFLTPLQIGLTVGTFGGSAVESAGTSVLGSLGVGEAEAGVVMRAAKATMSLGFTAQMLGGLMQQSPEFLDALKEGDTERATELGTNVIAGLEFLRRGGMHAIEDAKTIKNFVSGKDLAMADQIKLHAEIAGLRKQRLSEGSDRTKAKVEAFAQQLKNADITDKTTLRALRYYNNAEGNTDLLQKIQGVAEGSIVPRERTAEETAQMEAGVELRKWASESHDIFKRNDGSPNWLYAGESVPGAEGFGPTLHGTGEAKDAHYVQIKKPVLLEKSRLDSLVKEVADDGNLTSEEAQAAVRVSFQDRGYDGLVLKDEEGQVKVIPFDESQMRSVPAFKEAAKSAWNRDLVYVALDKKLDPMIKNAGLKGPAIEELQYHATPEDALKNAITPDSGDKKDLNVYAVPRSEIEQAVRVERTRAAGATAEGPRPLSEAPVGDKELISKQTHMPAYQLELDDQGVPTGRSTPLRPFGAEDLPQDNSRYLGKYSPEEKQEVIDALEKARNLTPAQIEAAKTMRALYDESFHEMWKRGLIKTWVQAYHPQAWAQDPNGFWQRLFQQPEEKVTNGAYNSLRDDAESGRFDLNVNQAKHRAFMTEFQGIMAGEKFKTDDPLVHMTKHLTAIEHAIANQDYVDGLMQKGVRAADGRPAAVMQGTTRRLGSDDNPAVGIYPDSIKQRRIASEIIQKMRETPNRAGTMTQLDEAIKNGAIEHLPYQVDVEQPDGSTRKEHAYAYATDGYASLDHHALKQMFYSGTDSAGNPAFMYGNIVLHPDFYTEVARTIGAERSPLRDSKILRGVAKVSSEAKGLLLSLSPFHIAQEGLRALYVGINPFNYDHIDIKDNPNLQRLVKNGLERQMFGVKDQFSGDYSAHSKLIGKIPVINKLQSWMQDFLFDRYIPGLKDRAALKMYEDLAEAHPHLTADEVASRAADMANDIFGGQNWQKLGWSTAQQDFAKMIFLAPDWLMSEIRMLGRAAGTMDPETRSLSRKFMIKQVAGMWLAARVLNMLVSGHMHQEAPFGVASKDDKGNEKIYTIRTLPTDMLHAMSDFPGFMRNRMNPLVTRPVLEAATGRDALGRRLTWDMAVGDLAKNVSPISAQGFFARNDVGIADQVMRGAGFAVQKYSSAAEKMASQYASDRMPSGPVDPRNLRAHQEDLRLEDALRQGIIGQGTVRNAVSKRRADEIIRRQHMTALQARVDRLPLAQIVDVWTAATPQEKTELSGMIWKKRNQYIKQHSAEERATDPTWRKLQSIHADIR